MIRSFAYDPSGGQLLVALGFTVEEITEAAADGGIFVVDLETAGELPDFLHEAVIREVQVAVFAATSATELMAQAGQMLPGAQFVDGCGECNACRAIADAGREVVEQATAITRLAAEESQS